MTSPGPLVVSSPFDDPASSPLATSLPLGRGRLRAGTLAAEAAKRGYSWPPALPLLVLEGATLFLPQRAVGDPPWTPRDWKAHLVRGALSEAVLRSSPRLELPNVLSESADAADEDGVVVVVSSPDETGLWIGGRPVVDRRLCSDGVLYVLGSTRTGTNGGGAAPR